MRFVWIALAGGAGSVCRYALSRAMTPPDAQFPFGTLTVNLLGCFAIGILGKALTDESARLAVITGFLGGFTTFSAFGLETLTLLRNGSNAAAVIYVMASNAGGIAAAWIGWRIAAVSQ